MITILFITLFFLILLWLLNFFWVRSEATRKIFYEMISISLPFFIGTWLGTSGFRLIDNSFLLQLSPLLEFCLGFQGLYWGLFFGFKDIRYFDVNVRHFSVLHAFFIFTVMLAASYFILYLAKVSAWEILLGSIYLSLALTQISSTSLLFLKNFKKYSASFAFLFKRVSGITGLFTILLLGFLSPIGISTSLPHYLFNLLFQCIMAFLIGHLMYLGIRRSKQTKNILIWLLSLLLINSGVSYYFGFNPLFMNLISGMVISSGGYLKEQIRDAVKPFVRPVILFLIFYTGLSYKMHPLITPLIVVGLVLLRYGLNYWSFHRFFSHQVLQVEEVKPILTSLISLGVLTPAIAVHLNLITFSPFSTIISTSLTLAYIMGYVFMILLVHQEAS